MGWASGSGLACEVYDLVRSHIPEIERQEIAKKIFNLFRDYDADDWDGSSDLEKDGKVWSEDE